MVEQRRREAALFPMVPSVEKQMLEDQQQWTNCASHASRIANQRLERAGGRNAFNKTQDQKPRLRSGLRDNPDGAWGNKMYGAWYGDSVAASWDAQHKAFGEAGHSGKVDFPWEFGQVGTKSSSAYGAWNDKKSRKVVDTIHHAEAHRPAERKAPKAPVVHHEKQVAPVRKFLSPGQMVADFNQAQMATQYHTHITKDQADHFSGASMNVGDWESEEHHHGCKHVGAQEDHFLGGGFLMSNSADEEHQFGHHGRAHVQSIEADHFVGHTMDLDGRGDIDLDDSRGVGKVASEGTSAQTSHFTYEMATLKEDAGGEGLYNTTGIISEMKHLGHSVDKNKVASRDHFAGGGMAMDANDPDAEGSDLLSVGGVGTAKKGQAAHEAGQGDHFSGGSMAIEQLAGEQHHSLTKHVGAHGNAEHSYDHFKGGGMEMSEQSASLDLLSVGGAGSQHLHKVEGCDRTKDSFEGNVIGEGVFEGLMSVGGDTLSGHMHVDGAPQSSDDHFCGGGMEMNATADAGGLVASSGTVMRGVGKSGTHSAGEHSYDHFSDGGMTMGKDGTTDSGIFSVSGVAMGKEKHHEMGKHGDKRFEDHFAGHGMGLSTEYNEGMGLTGANDGTAIATMKHSKYGAMEDHFGKGGLVVADGHGHTTKADEKRMNKNRHFVSFYVDAPCAHRLGARV